MVGPTITAECARTLVPGPGLAVAAGPGLAVAAGPGPSGGRWARVARAVGRRRDSQQSLGDQAAEHAAQAGGQASPFLRGEPGQDARLPGLPGLPDAVRDRAPLRGEVEADVAVVLLVAPAPNPPLALQAGRQPADRALLQAEEGRKLALGDAVRRQKFGQRAGLGGRDSRQPARRAAGGGGVTPPGVARRLAP